jgi:hypothetical protein
MRFPPASVQEDISVKKLYRTVSQRRIYSSVISSIVRGGEKL